MTDTNLAREVFRQALVKIVSENNFAPSYLARRCRTTLTSVESWLGGSSVPRSQLWWELCRVSRAFQDPRLEELRFAAESSWQSAAEDPVPDSSLDAVPAPAGATSTDVGTTPQPDRRVARRNTALAQGTPDDAKASRSKTQTKKPEPCVEFTCKIRVGMLLKIELPIDLTRADVAKIHAFMLSQVDEDQSP